MGQNEPSFAPREPQQQQPQPYLPRDAQPFPPRDQQQQQPPRRSRSISRSRSRSGQAAAPSVNGLPAFITGGGSRSRSSE